MQRVKEFLKTLSQSTEAVILLTVVFFISVYCIFGSSWFVSKTKGISEESAEVAWLGGRLVELHPQGRHDVVCFALKGYRETSLSCVKETPIEVELRKQQ
jgi:hypothetical protein